MLFTDVTAMTMTDTVCESSSPEVEEEVAAVGAVGVEWGPRGRGTGPLPGARSTEL